MEFKYIKVISNESFLLPNGKVHYIDNKRYGGNGLFAWERAKGRCENCGTYDKLCLHHNNVYSNELNDLMVLCRSCHRMLEEENKRWQKKECLAKK